MKNRTLKHYTNLWVADDINSKSKFWLYLGDFLDDFRRLPTLFSVIDEPQFNLEIQAKLESEQYWIIPFLGATCEYLCHHAGLFPPDWCYKEKYFCTEPYFSCKSYELHMILLHESPVEFRKRMLFVSNSVLSRV